MELTKSLNNRMCLQTRLKKMANSDNEVNSERENSIFVDSCVESMVVDTTPLTNYKDDTCSANQKTEEVIQLDSLLESITLDRLEHRAQRFGTELNPALKPISEIQLKGLCKSLDLDFNELFGSKGSVGSSKVRLDALHVRGVDDMNTEDVFDYFSDCGPVSVEWVNDHSCNVVWLDTTGPARALISLSQPMKRSRATANKEEGNRVDDEDQQEVDADDENKVDVVEMESSPAHIRHRSSSSVDSDGQQRRSTEQANTSAPHNSPAEAGEIEDDIIEVDASNVDVPIPPGLWRLGVPHPRAKFLLLRYAYRTDRKIQGAEKLSQYYLKNGNPNYKGLKGIISTSLKRKIKDVHRKPSGYVDLDAVDDEDALRDIEHSYDFDTKPIEQLKRPRMRMYADDEEEKTKVGTTTVTISSRGSRDLRNRIGNEKLSVSLGTNRDVCSSESSDLRLRLGSRPISQQPQWDDSSKDDIGRDLSRPSVIGDLRSKLEKLRQSRQPKVPLLIEISQDDV